MSALTLAALRAAPPKSIDEVDPWLARYMALTEEARAKEIARERLNDAAPLLLDACLTLIKTDGLQAAIDKARAAIDQALGSAS